MSELDVVIEKIIPIMHEVENGELELNARKLAEQYPAPLKKLIEVFGSVAEEHKLHIHIEERPYTEIAIGFEQFRNEKIVRIPEPSPIEWYYITWHKKEGDGCGRPVKSGNKD